MNNVTFTHYKSIDPLSKTFYIEGGELKKVAYAQFYRGKATRMTMPFKEIPAFMDKLSSHEVLGYGCHSLQYTDTVTITVKGKERPDKNILSRSLDHYSYKGTGLLCFDHDPNEYGKSYTREELLSILKAIHPKLSNCAMFIRGSVSAGVHLAGEQPAEGKGFHIYIAVSDASLIPAYGALLHKYLWLKNHGFIALSKVGSKLERSCLDSTVYSPERLDFVGKPIIRGEGLEYTPIPAAYYEGGLLDLSTLPELDEAEDYLYQSMVADAKEAIEGDAKVKGTQWAGDKVEAMVKAGTDRAKANKVVFTILNNDCADLYDCYPLEFANGERVTVAEVLKQPKQYDGKALADPMEGSSYGKTTAMFFWNKGAKPFINSMAHGGAKYYLHSTIEAASGAKKEKADYQIKYDEHCEKWNKTHMSTLVGGVHRIARVVSGDVAHDGRDSIEYCTNDALFKVYGNTSIQTGEKIVNGYIVPVYKNHFEAWRTHFDSLSFTGGVVFKPNSKVPDNCFNMWQGYSVKELENTVLLKRLKYHIENVVCDGDAELYSYLYKWIAYTFKHPERPAGAAVVLRGEEGAGKGILASFLQSIWGKHGYKVGSSKHLTGAFNAHLADVCYLFADEAFFSGDRQQADVLKGLVTESTMTIERKGVDSITQPNYLKIFMSTNSEYAVPAGRDSRRYFVTDVSSRHLKDESYFDPLVKDCNTDAVKAAFLYEMLNMDLTGFKTSQIPESRGLRSQRYHAMDSAQHWLVDVLLNGSLKNGNLSYGWEDKVQSSELYTAYQEWAVLNKISEFRMFNQTRLISYLNKIYQKANHIGERGRRGVLFGTLDNAVAVFEVFEKVCLAELTVKDEG
ncbi:MAG: DUF5906 domain-containing protein [Methylococcaceae bacterium]